jgi:ferredoxin
MTATPTLRIEPQGWQVPVGPGQSLLEAAQAAGVRLARSCRNGSCRACRSGLLDEEKAEGWILPCVALAEGDVVIEAPAAQRA